MFISGEDTHSVSGVGEILPVSHLTDSFVRPNCSKLKAAGLGFNQYPPNCLI